MSEIKKKNDIEKIFKSSKIENILFITGKNSFYKTKANEFFKKIFKNKKKFYYFKKNRIPEFEELKQIIQFKDRIKPALIIAVGGGCVMDYAKIVSVYKLGKNLKEKILSSDFNTEKIKVLAIPTTAGSGAESTSNAVIYFNYKKHSVEGFKIKPDYFCLISDFLLSSNFKVDASSGFDAISQSIESLFSLKSTPQSFEYATQGLKILNQNFFKFLKNKNKINSHQMMVGANLAGKAINISKTTLPHAISYPFTSYFKIPHGHAVSLTLNKFLKFNYFNQSRSKKNFLLKKRFDTLFSITNTKNIFELDEYVDSIKKAAKLEQRFAHLNIEINRDFNLIARNINESRLMNNPIKLNIVDIKHLITNF